MNARIFALASFASFAVLAPLCAGGVVCADSAAPFTVHAPDAISKVNMPGSMIVEVKPGKGYHFNKDFPTSLKLTAPPDLTMPAKLGKTDSGVKVAEEGASFEVKFTATSAGKKTVAGVLSFAVCTATTCDPRRVPVTLTIDVK